MIPGSPLPTLLPPIKQVLTTCTADSVRMGIKRNEFYLVMQPMFSMKTGDVCGCEVLLRWNHPKHGSVLPAYFIHHIEADDDLELDMIEWTIRQLMDVKNELAGREPFRMSINVSPKLLTEKFVDHLLEIVNERGQRGADWLSVELLERGFPIEKVSARECVRVIRENDINVSLDDFGTGSSSWVHLNSFEIDNIKIDRQFVQNVNTPKGFKILKGMTLLAMYLGLTVIAEGVETKQELLRLKEIGNIDYWQGFLGARPMPVKDFLEWLKAHKPLPL